MTNTDVLIITALKLEHDAARDAALRTDKRTYGVEKWEECDASSNAPYLRGTYVTHDGSPMTVALARPTRMGADPMLSLAAALVERLKPRCLAMCGVCAGNPDKVALGDVIIAEMVYRYDEGKVTPDGFEGDHRQTPMRDQWVRAAQNLSPQELPSFGQASVDISLHKEIEQLPFSIKVGPIATGNVVVKDGLTWANLVRWGVRSVLGLDMEAAAIGTLAHHFTISEWTVAKGVVDHADPHKNDRYQPFAARASAEVLFHFLSGRLTTRAVTPPPDPPSPPSTYRQLGPILSTGRNSKSSIFYSSRAALEVRHAR